MASPDYFHLFREAVRIADTVGLWVLHRVRDIEVGPQPKPDVMPEQLRFFRGYLIYRCADFKLRAQGTRSQKRQAYLKNRQAYWRRAIRWVEDLPPGLEVETANRCLHDMAAHPEYRELLYVAEHETADPRRDTDQKARAKRKPAKSMGRPRIHPVPVQRNRVCNACRGRGVLPLD